MIDQPVPPSLTVSLTASTSEALLTLIRLLGNSLTPSVPEASLNSPPTSPSGLTSTQKKEIATTLYREYRRAFAVKVVEAEAFESLGIGDSNVSPVELALRLNDQWFEEWMEREYADQS